MPSYGDSHRRCGGLNQRVSSRAHLLPGECDAASCAEHDDHLLMMGDYDAHELPDEPGFLSRYRLVESDDDEPPPLVDASDDSESDDEDVERTKMSSADALNVESLLLASETCPRRLELYDSGATNMFRALASNECDRCPALLRMPDRKTSTCHLTAKDQFSFRTPAPSLRWFMGVSISFLYFACL